MQPRTLGIFHAVSQFFPIMPPTSSGTLPPLQGLNDLLDDLPQGGADFVSLALGYHLPDLRPLKME
jgi:hypothetical protein